MSLGLKLSEIRSTAFPIAIYGCESWAMTSGDKTRVDAFEMWCYRRLLSVSWMERKTNKWVLEKIGSVLMLRKSMSERNIRFFDHMVRKNGMEKRLMQWKMEGKRRRADQQLPGFERMDQNLDIAVASQIATDRERWRKIITKSQLRRQRHLTREREREGGERHRERERERERAYVLKCLRLSNTSALLIKVSPPIEAGSETESPFFSSSSSSIERAIQIPLSISLPLSLYVALPLSLSLSLSPLSLSLSPSLSLSLSLSPALTLCRSPSLSLSLSLSLSISLSLSLSPSLSLPLSLSLPSLSLSLSLCLSLSLSLSLRLPHQVLLRHLLYNYCALYDIECVGVK